MANPLPSNGQGVQEIFSSPSPAKRSDISPSKVAEQAATDAAASLGRHGLVLQKLLICMAADLANEADKCTFWQAIAKGTLFEPTYTRVYAPTAGFYGTYGGKPYHKPRGWMRFGLHRPNFDDAHSGWCHSYHGTRG